MGKIIVAKFGGTSMADAAAISQSAKVATINKACLVVVSATQGTTNALVELSHAILANKPEKASKIIQAIVTNHIKIARALSADKELLTVLDQIFENLSAITTVTTKTTDRKKITDQVLSIGEQLSSNLMIAALAQQKIKAELVDAKEIIKTDNHFGYATPKILDIAAAAKKVLIPKINSGTIFVTQGFIGCSPEGETTTLGRGGSDYSAALLAEALGAEELQIWTDTNGISSADPRIITGAKRIDQLSFQEAAELATAGAQILYPKTITPTRRAKIPVFVGNTFDPDKAGTMICEESDHRPLMRAISIKTEQSILRLSTPEMAHEFGFLAKIFDLFAKHKISVDQISTSEITIALVIENQTLINQTLFDELEKLGEVSIEKNLSVISLIGNNVNKAPGLAQQIFANLEDAGEKISVRMICQGASYHNFCFVISDKHGLNMVNKLHNIFIEKEANK